MSGEYDDDSDAEHADDGPGRRAQCWRFSLHIAYIGTSFVGWQRQIETSACGKSSVQELVEDVITELLEAPKRVNVTSVSRTDAGTHALYVRAT